MNFKLKVTPGTKRKTYKRWLNEDKTYRITWSREIFKVVVPPHFHACVRLTLPCGRVMWDFVGKRGSYKTFKMAVEAANKHKELWTKAAEATGIREIESIFGKCPLGIPVGAKLKRSVQELITQKYLL